MAGPLARSEEVLSHLWEGAGLAGDRVWEGKGHVATRPDTPAFRTYHPVDVLSSKHSRKNACGSLPPHEEKQEGTPLSTLVWHDCSRSFPTAHSSHLQLTALVLGGGK